MKVLFVSSEVAPFSKTGGLADVAGALPRALAGRGLEVLTLTPLWPQVPREGLEAVGDVTLHFPFGAVTVRALRRGQLVFVEQPHFFDRQALYGEADDARRFAVFSMGTLALCQRLGFEPDVVHLNDWQVGLCALALSRGFSTTTLRRARSVFTIHNLAFTGSFEKHTVLDLGLPWELFTPEGIEFHDRVSFLKAGLVYADALTTVSPTYAKEVQTPEGGHGLDGLLRHRAGALTGILNGIDVELWNPASDPHLAAHYRADRLEGKEACTRALLTELGLRAGTGRRPPLFGTVGRLADQKGVDLLVAALPGVLDRGACAVVVGSGEPRLVEALRGLEKRYRGQVHLHIGFDEALAHRVESACDFFVMPSKYEPCGLNQMYSLRYGAVPVVRAVGGLEDTVVDLSLPGGTGIKFEPFTAHALFEALERAMALWAQPLSLSAVRRRGMAVDFSWASAAAKYEALYRQLR